jgi:streptogramin lyase
MTERFSLRLRPNTKGVRKASAISCKTKDLDVFGPRSHQIVRWMAVLLLAMAATWRTASAQDRYPVDRISLEQGLSQSIAKCILKDRRGFMWFGTESGLNRYDGFTFRVYKQIPFDETSISNNDILTLCEDSTGMIWVGTSTAGLNMFDPRTERFSRYQNRPDDPGSISSNTVLGVFCDRRNELWIVTAAGGLDHFDRRKGRFHHHGADDTGKGSLGSNVLIDALEDENGVIWIATDDGIDRYDRSRDAFVHIGCDASNPHCLNYPEVLAVFQSKRDRNTIWFGTGDRRSLSAGGGLNKLDLTTGVFTRYSANRSDPHAISSDIVGHIIEDSDGILWVGTARGLNRFDPSSGRFSAYLPEPRKPDDMRNVIRAMQRDIKGDIWIIPAAGFGVYQFKTRTRTFVHYAYDANNPRSLSSDNVISFYHDPSGVLWFGTNTGGLSKIDLYSRKFRTYRSNPSDPNSLLGDLVRSMAIDRQGQLWVGTGSGLNRFSTDRRQVTRYNLHDHGGVSQFDNRVWAICYDHTGMLWIGSAGGGLARFDPATGAFIHFRANPDDDNAISSNFIRAVFEDSHGRLWIGTETGGLNLFDRSRGVFHHFVPRSMIRLPSPAGRSDVLWKTARAPCGPAPSAAVWCASSFPQTGPTIRPASRFGAICTRTIIPRPSRWTCCSRSASTARA